MTEYRASLFAQGYFGHLLCTTALLLVLVFVTTGERAAAIILSMAFLAALVRLRSRRMIFSETAFIYDGWWARHEHAYADIQKVIAAEDFGYPTDRYRSRQFCVVTNTKRFWVSTLWFPSQACRAFSDTILRRYRSCSKT